MSIDIESASRDELVAFYNENKPEEGEALSVASSKDIAKAAVEALLAAEADQSVEEAAAEEAATMSLETDVQSALEADGFEVAAVETVEVDGEETDPESYDDADQVEAPADDEAEADEEQAEDEEAEFCEMCGGAGLVPRCPACETERRNV